MVGYPWETKKEALNTLNLAKKLFKNGWIDSLQATIVVPYPGTPLFKEAKENNWLKTTNWDRYDMKEPIMRTPMGDEELMRMVRAIYSSFLTPRFIFRKLKEGLSSGSQFKYYSWLAWKFFSKRIDFAPKKKKK